MRALKLTLTQKELVSYLDKQLTTFFLDFRGYINDLGIAVPELRPKELATDTAGTYEVLLHEIKKLESRGKFFSHLILLQPTSPFRKGHHIKEALGEYNDSIDIVVSVKETKANPYYVLREEDEHRFLIPSKNSLATRRQDVPKVWEVNGAIYIINIESLKVKPINQFKKVKKYEMNEIASHDIDTMMDWKIAEVLINNN